MLFCYRTSCGHGYCISRCCCRKRWNRKLRQWSVVSLNTHLLNPLYGPGSIAADMWIGSCLNGENPGEGVWAPLEQSSSPRMCGSKLSRLSFFLSFEISWRFFLFNFPCFINYYIHPSLISFLFQNPSCWISSRNKVIWIFVSFVGLIELVCDETSF